MRPGKRPPPRDVLEKAGIVLGENYPDPLVDHGEARARALAAYSEIRKG
jgi:deoxyribodipyrimidine photo-lyase